MNIRLLAKQHIGAVLLTIDLNSKFFWAEYVASLDALQLQTAFVKIVSKAPGNVKHVKLDRTPKLNTARIKEWYAEQGLSHRDGAVKIEIERALHNLSMMSTCMLTTENLTLRSQDSLSFMQ